jgi:hypothetical protein
MSHAFVAAAGSARAESVDLWDERLSVAAFDFGPAARVLELASSDDLADRVADQPLRP